MADKAQTVLAGFEGSFLTPLQYRFALVRAHYPESKLHSNTWCLRQAGSSADANCAKKLASQYMANPLIQGIIQREREKQLATIKIEGAQVLADLVTLKDMSMGRLPKVQGEYDPDRDAVLGREYYSVDATAALKALELLGKHAKLWTDKIEHTVNPLDAILKDISEDEVNPHERTD